MTRILVADDSEFMRSVLVQILAADPELEIAGEAKDGLEVVEMNERLKPDVITMDIRMPGMDGFEATEKIMASRPVPIVVVSALENLTEGEAVARALTAGALTVLRKPPGLMDPSFQTAANELASTVKGMAKVLVRKLPAKPSAPSAVAEQKASAAAAAERLPAARGEVVGIVASIGGPSALLSVLSDLPKDFPAPIVVVQHRAPGFLPGLAASLSRSASMTVTVAVDGDELKPGTVYLAPDDQHISITPKRVIRLSTAGRILGFRPSATYLFGSLATSFREGAICVVLSGTGEDGIEGLRLVKQAGGAIIVQDASSAVVHETAKAAISAGLAHIEASTPVIPELLRRVCAAA